MPTPPHEIYHSQMTEVKMRILAAERSLNAASPVTGLASLDCEFCYLQVRKVIELVAFSGLVREEGRYRRFRTIEKRKPNTPSPDPAEDWRAKDMLSRLVKLSPHMLPIPLGKHTRSDERTVNFDRARVVVNHGKLIELYEDASGFLHVPNPLVENYKEHVEQKRQKYKEAPGKVRKALTFLRELLWLHAAVQLEWTDTDDPSSVENPTSAWIIDFSNPADDVVHMTLAAAQ